MKLAIAMDSGGHKFLGLITNDDREIVCLESLEKMIYGTCLLPKDMAGAIQMGDQFLLAIRQLAEKGKEENFLTKCTDSLANVTLLPPIEKPPKNILCIGKNYREHAIEMGSEKDIPEDLIVFTKAPTTIIGPLEKIPDYSDITAALDYEGELAVVIGKKGRRIPKEKAIDHIFGYTIINDITARDLQSRHQQYFLGKSLDGSCPMGPWIVHKSAADNPNDLNITTKVNGEIRQNSSTSKFIFSIEEIIETLSQGMTLEPGDIIATGTPSGVGKGFHPPRYLKGGDVVEITIEGIGTLVNEVELQKQI